MKDFALQLLPPKRNLETIEILKLQSEANKQLALLRGVSQTIPNQGILINTLPLLEAKDSSAIENIITTHDELYREGLFPEFLSSASAKEVQSYSSALKTGFEKIRENRQITNNQLIEIHQRIENNDAGFRKLPGTSLINDKTGETVYTPPQNQDDIIRLMNNLEIFINDDSVCSYDYLIKMAIIHYQFESIHPFYDGNGRTGRIINILYLVLKGLLDIPVLYLSRFIIKNKQDYYRLLQEVRENDNWEDWIIFMLTGVESTSKDTIKLITGIRALMQDYKFRIRKNYKFYSQELINNLFSHPYTKIEFVERDLRVHRQTASKYLDKLVSGGFLKLETIGKNNFYINVPLFNLFVRDKHD